MAGFEMCAALPGRVRRPGRPPLPRPAQRLPGVRADPAAAARRRPATRHAAARSPRCAGPDRRGQGHRRLPPRLPARTNEAAVAALRARKHREDKPFAVMVRDVDRGARARVADRRGGSAARGPRPPDRARAAASRRGGRAVGRAALGRPRRDAALHAAAPPAARRRRRAAGDDERQRLRRADRLRRRRRARAAGRHRRPLALPRPPDPHAHGRLGAARSIHPPRRPLLLRRSRGYVPDSLALPVPAARHCSRAAPSSRARSASPRASGRGSATTSATSRPTRCSQAFEAGIEHFERLFAVVPEVVAHDVHPDYLSTRYALDREGVEHVAVQHHHAHLAACLAEHGETGPAVGAIFDGTGYGSDGTVWGGELLVGDLRGLRARRRTCGPCACRAATARCASRGGWRSRGCSRRAGTAPLPARPARRAGRRARARPGSSSPVTTSMGRLFDAVAALCGLRAEVTYEGQAGGRARGRGRPGGARRLRTAGRPRTACSTRARPCSPPRRTWRRGAGPGTVAARFHAAVAAGTAEAVEPRPASRPSCSPAASSRTGRCSLGDRGAARGRGLRVLVPERLPPNDGGDRLRAGGGGGSAALVRVMVRVRAVLVMLLGVRAAPARPMDREVAEARVVAELRVQRRAHVVQRRRVERGHATAAVADQVLAVGPADERVEARAVRRRGRG